MLSAVAFVKLSSRWDDRPSRGRLHWAARWLAAEYSAGCEKEEEEEERGEKRSETLVERDGASADSHPVKSGRTADPIVIHACNHTD